MKKLLLLLTGIAAFLAVNAAEPAPADVWQALAVGGAEGTVAQEEGQWVVNKTKHQGFLTARLNRRPAVIPGHCYRISLEFQTDAGTIPGYLQIITLPQKRTPYPCSAMIYPIGKPRKVSCFLKMGPNETSIIINLVTKGHGKAVILGTEVAEISEKEYQEALAAQKK